ncbi:hypothetical protein SynA1560_00907 [Synechococcus sp. A15-60]|nr:hypothetical protein SynA1560_00907 [Synechococcus sp. A15-60]
MVVSERDLIGLRLALIPGKEDTRPSWFGFRTCAAGSFQEQI